MQRSVMEISQDRLEQFTDSAHLQQIHIDLNLTFDANMLKSTSDADDFGSFLEEKRDHLSMILLPAHARGYYPLIAAAYSIKVKPLALFSLRTELVQLSSFEHIQLKRMTPIRDSKRIIRLLALNFSDKSDFSKAVSFRCLVGFEMPSADTKLEIVLSQVEEVRREKLITIAVGITTKGIMYIYHHCPIQYDQMHAEMCDDDPSVMISLLRAVIIIAVSKLKIREEREDDNICESQSSFENADHVERATDMDFLILSVVVHAADTDLIVSLQNLSLQGDEEKEKKRPFYFDVLLLSKLPSGNSFKGIISNGRDNENNSRNCPINEDADKIIRMRAANIDHIFLLMGQSNMAGRGDLEELKHSNLDSSLYGELINNVLLFFQ